MKKILLITGNYLPGFKAGGPIQSMKGFTWLLEKIYDINILTRDRDLGDKTPYKSIIFNEWNLINDTKVMYTTSKKIKSFKFLKSLINNTKYDLIYLQSFFDSYTRKVLILKKLKLINSKILLAPRGELGESALKKGELKKKIYLFVFKLFLLDKNIIWQATSIEEKERIIHNFKNAKVYYLENIKKEEALVEKKIKKDINKIKLIFISRIVEHKNLYFILERIEELNNLNFEITLDIYGPLENIEYWGMCEKKILEISKNRNIRIRYKGSLKNEEVISKIKEYHYLILPTKGENFGHIIIEALFSKTPLIISDRTPWKNLGEKKIGYDIPLEDKKMWNLKLKEIIEQNDSQYKIQVENIELFYKENFDIEKKKKLYIKSFEEILGRKNV